MGSNPAESDGFLTAIKICSATSFGREIQLSAHVVRFYGMLNDPLRYDRDTDRKNSAAYFSPSFSPLCYYVSLLQPEQRTLVDELGTIRTQMGSTIDQKMVAVEWNAL
jgi:hypothetical protein